MKLKETDNGTDMVIRVPGEMLYNQIHKFKVDGQNGIDAEIRINDGRTITVDQRKKIYATIKDISIYTGDEPGYLKECLKYDYCAATGDEYFSLSNCSVTTARNFISHLIDFILAWDIPLSEQAINRTDDIDRYLYSCIKYRKCCITGNPNAEIHHCEGSRVGMGRNRKKISHNNLELMALSSDWHNRVHIEGEEDIFKAHKIYGITVDIETLKQLGLKYEDIS